MADDYDEELDIDDDTAEDDDLDLEVVDLDDADTDTDVEDVEDVDIDAIVTSDTPADTKAGPADESSDDEDDDNLDLEEELHPDDVEEPLDVLLAERTAAERIDEEEADLEDDDEPEVGAEGGGKIVPRRDDEFLCRSCFLVKPLSQLAKGEKDLCRDCE